MTALTPDDLARIEGRARSFYLYGLHANELIELDVPALVAGVRSLQARITELEAVIAAVPHAIYSDESYCADYDDKPCDCWKSRYRAGATHG